MEEIAIKIKQLRIEKELTQSELAKMLNVKKTTLGAWERGTNEPPLFYVIKLADYFNVTIDYLTGREEEDGRIIVQELELPSDEKKVLEKYRILPPELKAVSYEYIKSLGNLNEEFNIKRKRNL